ncbi:MAG: proline racemase family protein [Crocinitomicaceae bacterium]|nr:proline racemase family protein [Crocinitomicaceae bacterium]
MTTFDRIRVRKEFTPPEDWLQIRTIDMHTGGEPLRVIIDGFPELAGDSVLDYRRFIKDNHDNLRTTLMFEPRGHADMYGCILTPPNDAEGDFGIIFLHNEGYSTMCGHAIIAISTLAVHMNWIDVNEGENELKIDAPCGRIISYIKVKNGEVLGVRFHCVPSFVVALDREVKIPGIGVVQYDLAYGGAFYAYVDMNKHNFDFDMTPESYRSLIAAGMDIKQAVMENDDTIKHPYESDLSFLYGTIFTGDSITKGVDSRNVCVFAEGEVDRCPTGSGVAGRMAIQNARKKLKRGEKMSIESIMGSVFTGSIYEKTKYGEFDAVIPEVEGTAHIVGMQTFVIDPKDPMKNGFILR